MASVLVSLLHSLRFLARSRASLHLEIVALRHQLAIWNRRGRSRPLRARYDVREGAVIAPATGDVHHPTVSELIPTLLEGLAPPES